MSLPVGLFGHRRTRVLLAQLAVIVLWLVAWQYLPNIPALSTRSHLLDVFFISSPTRVAQRLYDLATGSHDTVRVWKYVWPTLSSSLVGLALGMLAGGTGGLLLSASRFLSQVFQPFLVALNAIPRIAIIPIVVIVFGATFQSSVVLSFIVVFFVVFWNAYEGGRAVAPHLLQCSRVFGATRLQIMLHVRLPYVLAWALASLPLAATFALLSVVTGEILTGYSGMGRLITVAETTADSTLTIAVAVILSVLGLGVVAIAALLKRRVLHWWVATQQD
jgi:NitT/TauT family transport system permease protein